MSEDPNIEVTITFKTPGQPFREKYQMKRSELDRLAKEFKSSTHTSGGSSRGGTYEAATTSGHPRVLAIRFEDVLFIG